MKIEIRYQSKSGNTEKLANAVAKAAGVTAASVSVPLNENCDVLFLGGAIYAGMISGALKKFIKGISAGQAKMIVLFSTAASDKGIFKAVEKRLKDKNILLFGEELHLRSKDLEGNIGAADAFVKKALASINTK